MSIYSNKIYPFVEKLVREHNFDSGRGIYELSFDDLEIDEQQELAKMMLIYKDEDLESIYHNDDIDLIRASLISMIGNPDIDNRLCFAELLMEKIVKYYQPQIQKIIDEIISWVEQEDREEAGLQYERLSNGDFHISKRIY